MPERILHPAPWTALLLLLLSLLLFNVHAANILPSSSSASAISSANQRSVRSAESANSLAVDDDEEKNGCSSDFVENFFRLLSGPVGKEGEALVAAVLKLLSENDRVNWPEMSEWSTAFSQSRDLAASKLRQIFLDGAQRIRGNEKRLAPKFNPTGWRRKRSTNGMLHPLDSLLQGLLAKYDTSELLRQGYARKVPELSDDLGLAEIPGWIDQKRNDLPERVSRQRPPQRMPKRKPLEFNPTGW